MPDATYDIIVIGGGPAGSMASLMLARAGYSVCLMERRTFPRETLCGEFLSHEVAGIINDLGLERAFLELGPSPLTRFALCPDRGPVFTEALGFTAYGLRRGAFDQFLLNEAVRQGAHLLQPVEAQSVRRRGNRFEVTSRMNGVSLKLHSQWCIGAYGKSSPLDKQLSRRFAGIRTRMNGIKFHVPASALTGLDVNEIQIFTGPDIYCGINHAGSGTATICFLERRERNDTSPRARLRELAAANKHFARVVSEKALSAIDRSPIYGSGNIYFGERKLIEDGVMMIGDAGRVISPLAGDGIGMALQSGQLIGRIFGTGVSSRLGVAALETEYINQWKQNFSSRLRTAAALQRIILSAPLRYFSSTLLSISPSLLRRAITMTRSRNHWHALNSKPLSQPMTNVTQ